MDAASVHASLSSIIPALARDHTKSAIYNYAVQAMDYAVLTKGDVLRRMADLADDSQASNSLFDFLKAIHSQINPHLWRGPGRQHRRIGQQDAVKDVI